jgi:hypothetical protein
MENNNETKVTKIKDIKDTPIWKCKCGTDQEPKYISWNSAKKEILAGDDGRAALFCDVCGNQIGIFSLENEVNVEKLPKI